MPYATSRDSIAIGIDVGGTNTKLGVLQGTVLISNRTIATEAAKGPEDTCRRIASLVKEMCRDNLAVSAIGIGLPGLVENGVFVGGLNLSPSAGWQNVPLKRMLEDEFRRPVEVMMDLVAVSSGELLAGGHGPANRMFVLTLGTGVGGAVVMDGRVYAGAGGLMLFNTSRGGEELSNLDTLEGLVSGPAIVRRASEMLVSVPRSLLGQLASQDQLTAASICEAALQGDALANEVWRRTGEHLGLAAVNIAHLLLADRIIVGGGVSRAKELLLRPAQEVFQRYLTPALAERCFLTLSTLGADAGIIGAACVARRSVVESI